MTTSVFAGYCETMIAVAPSRWPVRKLLNQFGRYFTAYLLIHNYYGWKAGEAPLPTLARLKAMGSLSPRHVVNVVNILKTAGFVTADAVEGERRRTVLRPEPELVDEIGRSLLAFLAAGDRVEGTALAAAVAASPEALGRLIHRSACQVLAGGATLSPFPTILAMTRFDSGYPLLVALMAAHYARSEGREPVPLTLESLAERFQVSKSHVGNVIGHLAATGLIDGARVASPALVAEFETWCRAEMAHYGRLAAVVLAEGAADRFALS